MPTTKSWSETVRLPQPVREIRLARVIAAEAAARLDLEEQVRAGYERGRAEAERDLRDQLYQQRAEVQELFGGVLKSLRDAVPSVVHDTERTLVALALEVAQKLVSGLPVSAEMVEAAVREALAQIDGTAEFHVRLHPADLELLHKVSSSLLTEPGASGPIRFSSSSEVTRGGCLVQTRFGVIDGRREGKLEVLERSLLP